MQNPRNLIFCIASLASFFAISYSTMHHTSILTEAQNNSTLIINAEEFCANSGVNLPWGIYSEDFGSRKAGKGFADFKPWLEERFQFFKDHNVAVVRVWIFGDARSGIIEGQQGSIKINASCNRDARTLLDTARKYSLKLILSLYDFSIGDKISFDFGENTGEHPDWIKTKRNKLLNAVMPFIKKLQKDYSENILCWEIGNELLNGRALVQTEEDFKALKKFVKNHIESILSIKGAKVTLGIRNHYDAVHYWGDIIRKFQDRMILQFHYYKGMELNYETALANFTVGDFLSELGVGAMKVLLGEMDPTLPDSILNFDLNWLRQKGFAGVLYWQDYNYLYEIDYNSFKTQIEEVRRKGKPVAVNVLNKKSSNSRESTSKSFSPTKPMVMPLQKWHVHGTGGKNDAIWYRKINHSNDAFEKVEITNDHITISANFDGSDRRRWQGEIRWDLDNPLDLSDQKIGLYILAPKNFWCNRISNGFHLILEDSDGRRLHAPWVSIPIADHNKWNYIEYSPSSTAIPLGRKEVGFNLHSISSIGFMTKLGAGSSHKYKGKLLAGPITIVAATDSLFKPNVPLTRGGEFDSKNLVNPDEIRLFEPGNTWRQQTYLENSGIEQVELTPDGKLVVKLNLIDQHPAKGRGEIILDLPREAKIANCEYLDLRNKVISLTVSNPKNKPNLNIQIFFRDKDSQLYYGTEIPAVSGEESRIRMFTLDSSDAVDLSAIEKLGVKIYPSRNKQWKGELLLKKMVLSDTANVSWNAFDANGSLNILENDQNDFYPLITDGSWAILSIPHFSNPLPDSNERLTVRVRLEPTDKQFNQGELVFKTRSNPPIEGRHILDLTDKKIIITTKMPPDIIGSADQPNGLQLFVKDGDYNSYYTEWENIKAGINKLVLSWKEISGSVNLKNIVEVGLKIALGSNSDFAWKGTFEVVEFRFEEVEG